MLQRTGRTQILDTGSGQQQSASPEEFDPEKIILFGSHANGTATVHSDIDLLIIFKDVEDKREQAVAIQTLLADCPISEDIIIATEQDVEKYKHSVSSVLRFATEEGKIIYERTE